MSCSGKNNRLSKLFRILVWVGIISGPVSVFLLIFFFANSIPKKTIILLMILIGIIWFIMIIILTRLYKHFEGKYMDDTASELGLHDILETNINLAEYDPLRMLPKQTLLNCSAIFPDDFFVGKISCYGSQIIRGKYNNKSFEMSAAKLVYTRNTAGQPSSITAGNVFHIILSKPCSFLMSTLTGYPALTRISPLGLLSIVTAVCFWE